ncbi:MAG: hypothetical protein L6Q80_11995 [Dehalococcoidia bacterium]|nr:hypothetical protein [Candidatus Binatia bacterium]MCK6565450.1 hypothetical protein [Dehalococcoidia bacterium]
MPGARYPDNGIDNLVATDPACNNHKRDFLAAGEHVARGVYLRLPDDVELWVRRREFAPVAQQIATLWQALASA